jgi:hypothetical protein
MSMNDRRTIAETLLSEEQRAFLASGTTATTSAVETPITPTDTPEENKGGFERTGRRRRNEASEGTTENERTLLEEDRWEKLSIRVASGTASRVRQLALERRNRGARPYAIQGILGEALEEWIKKELSKVE